MSFINKLQNLDSKILYSKNPLEVFANLLSKINNKDILEELIRDIDLYPTLTKHSYSHYNGFDKLTVFEGNNFNFRLHISFGKDEKKIFNENIHDHKWDFCSKLILGEYTSQVYNFDDNGEYYYSYKYNSVKNKENYSLIKVDKMKLKRLNDKLFKMGMMNFSRAGDLHRIIFNPRIDVATFFITTNYKKEFAWVLNENPLDDYENIKAVKMTKKEILLIIGKLVEKL